MCAWRIDLKQLAPAGPANVAPFYPGPNNEVHGKVLGTSAPYDNRFVSIITVADRKIVHWRDYMDSLAAWNALNPRSS